MYTPAIGEETLVTINGVKSLSGLSLNNKVVTVSNVSLDDKEGTISGTGYTLKLADDVAVPSVMAPAWTVKSTNATLHTDTSAGYAIEDSKVVYSAKKTGEAQIALAGLAENAKLVLPKNKTLTLDASILGTNTSIKSNASGYTVKLTGNMSGKTFFGTSEADTVSIATESAIVNSGTGNDELLGGKGNDSLAGGSGNDSLNGGDGKDTLSGDSGDDILFGSTGNDSLNGDDGKDIFIYKPGEGSDIIFDYERGDMLKILKADGSEGGSFTTSSFKSNNLTLAISGGGKVIFDNVSASDSFNINGTIYTISGKKLK